MFTFVALKWFFSILLTPKGYSFVLLATVDKGHISVSFSTNGGVNEKLMFSKCTFKVAPENYILSFPAAGILWLMLLLAIF